MVRDKEKSFCLSLTIDFFRGEFFLFFLPPEI
jgi:hypothetical protein